MRTFSFSIFVVRAITLLQHFTYFNPFYTCDTHGYFERFFCVSSAFCTLFFNPYSQNVSYPVDRKSLFFENPENVLLFLVQSLHDGYYFFFISASKKFQKVNITFWNFFITFSVFGVSISLKCSFVAGTIAVQTFDAYIISSESYLK